MTGFTAVSSGRTAWVFGTFMLRASLRDGRTTATVLLTPVLMALVFRFVGEGAATFVLFFPAVLTMSLMFVGLPLATRIVTWRVRGVFRRLACTPQPLGRLLLALAAGSAGLGFVQALLILALGGVLGVPLRARLVGGMLPFLALGALCFTAYGVLLAGFARQPEAVNVLYVFTLLPMTFAAPVFVPSTALPPLVARVAAWLPPALLARGLQAHLLPQHPPEPLAGLMVGLLTYTLVFSMVSMRRFRRL